jgi:hypothetical protein
MALSGRETSALYMSASGGKAEKTIILSKAPSSADLKN